MTMRNPNGYGTVYKLSGKRRKPFIARVTLGWSDTGKQLFATIGYYAKKSEALNALAEHNKNPNYIDIQNITFEDVYNRLVKTKYENKAEKCPQRYSLAFNRFEKLHKLNFINITTDSMQEVFDKSGVKYPTKRIMKTVLNLMYEYAISNKIVDTKYSKYVQVGKRTNSNKHIPFTQKEINFLWDNEFENSDIILIYIFTGLRPSELLEMKNSDINLAERYMKGGMKSEAGKDRIIPIHKDIVPLIQNRMTGNEYLILNEKDEKMRYFNYYNDRFMPLMEQIGFSHTPHDTRHTFATLMDNAGANKLSIKRIMGHASKDVTDKVYTHKDIEELKKAVDLLVTH